MEIKETKTINGIEWKCYKKENGKDYLTTTDVLSEEVVKEIVDNEMNRYENGMRYNTNVIDSSWENSIPRKVLNDKFKEKYLSDIELTEEVRLLTKEEVENLEDEFHEVSDWYWTMTEDTPSSSLACVFTVRGSSNPGHLNSNYVGNTTPGVRPVISLNSEILDTDVTDNIANDHDCEVIAEVNRNASSEEIADKLNELIRDRNNKR